MSARQLPSRGRITRSDERTNKSSSHRRRRGVVSVLAMIFLVLMTVMALGLYASATTSAVVADNEQHAFHADLAVTSGTYYLRYQMGNVRLPLGTQADQILDQVNVQLAARMNGTANLAGQGIGYTAGTSIAIPAAAGQYIPVEEVGSKYGFRADLTREGSDVVVTITGRDESGTGRRASRMNYRYQPDTSILDYGFATKSSIKLSGGFIRGVPDAARGGVLATTTATATPITMNSSAEISGDVYFSNAAATISGSGTLAGTTNTALWPSHVHKPTPAPQFPVVVPDPFINYLVGKETLITSGSGGPYFKNIRIKAGANPNFSGHPTIEGVILIEAPNQVTFSGGTHIRGVIVVDKPDDATATNSITFSGGGQMEGPETLDASFGELRGMTGSAILAPNFNLKLSGGSTSFGGTIIAKSVMLSGGAGGSAYGSVITYGPSAMTWSGGSGFTFTNSGPARMPFGTSFSGRFEPVPSTYTEIR